MVSEEEEAYLSGEHLLQAGMEAGLRGERRPHPTRDYNLRQGWLRGARIRAARRREAEDKARKRRAQKKNG